MFITFLKRLVGTDEESLETQRRFNQGLNSLTIKNKELSDVGERLEECIQRVYDSNVEIANSPVSSGASGEHRLDLNIETEESARHGRNDRPAGRPRARIPSHSS